MRNAIFLLAVVALTAVFTSGCAGPEEKLGRGANKFMKSSAWAKCAAPSNSRPCSIRRVTVMPRRVRGIDRSLTRVGMGVFEVATFPLPPYGPVLTKYFSPEPAFPASYKPQRVSDALFDTDTYTGFSGGDVMPFLPGSRFSIFDN